MSFLLLVSRHLLLKLKTVSYLLHAGELPGSSRCPLVRRLLHMICLKDPRYTVIVLPVEDRPEVAVLVHHSVLIRPRHVGVTCCCLCPTFEVKMAV
jgi:hypothetical protein